jgi:hypothetical protein
MMLVRSWLLAVLGSVLVAVGVGGVLASPVFAAGDANKPQCAAETETSPGFRNYLPDCRAYELVTPPYKDSALVLGAGGEPVAVSENGEQVLMMAGGAFAGAGNAWFQGSQNASIDAYELTRGASGWQPTALTPSAAKYPYSHMMAATPDLDETLWGATTSAAFNEPSVNEDIYLRNASGIFSLVGPGVAPKVAGEELSVPVLQELTFAGASRDLTHLLFEIRSEPQNGHSNLWPGDSTIDSGFSLYEYSYAGAPKAEPQLVGIKNEGLLAGSPLNEGAELISICNTALGASHFGGSTYNAVSADGETVFFTAGACSGAPAVNELYARVGGEKTVAISEPSLPAGACSVGEPCSGATHRAGLFEGASEDGERVFFLSEQPLVNGAPAAGMKLYEARLAGEGRAARVAEVIDVSADPTAGQSPEVQGVVRASENGERVYFVAQSVLTSGKNAEEKEPDETEAGEDNLYVYDTETRGTVFVGTLLSPAEEASIAAAERKEQEIIHERAHAKYGGQAGVAEGEFERGEISGEQRERIIEQAEQEENAFVAHLSGELGPAGPRGNGTLGTDIGVWGSEDDRSAQATPNGGFLAFLSSANLTGDDEKRVPQLFEYDATTEKLTRVSIGQDGNYEHDGAVETFGEAPSIPDPIFNQDVLPTARQSRLAVSGDGSQVFFTSAGRLAPEAVRGDTNVYEYREGNVYLISDGRDGATQEDGVEPAVQLFGADSSGGDVFFTSADALVPQDAESQLVLYDAHEGGGFPAPVLAAGCVGETCRGSSTTTPQLGVAGSASQPAGGNLTPSVAPPPPITPKKTTKAIKCAKGKKLSHGKCVKKKSKKKAKKAKRASRDRRGK